MYGILVIGAPGAGKSTFCAGLSEIFEHLKRNHYIVNLDPANDSVLYQIDLDIKVSRFHYFLHYSYFRN